MLGLVCICTALAVFGQPAELTLWSFPEPDPGATDLVIAEDGQIVLAFFTGMAIGRFNPVDHSLVEWAL